MEHYATAFERAGRLDRLEAFASLRGPDFYRLPRNTQRVTLKRETYVIAQEVPYGDETLVPLAAGESLAWRLA